MKKKFLATEIPRSRWGGVCFWAWANSIDELKQLFPNGYEFTEDYNDGRYLDENWPTFDIDDQPDALFTGWIAISHGKTGFWCKFDVDGVIKEAIVDAPKKRGYKF